jgi:syntaxin 16
MATRSWTRKYESLRNEIKSKSSASLYVYEDPTIEASPQPLWINLQTNISQDIYLMKNLLKKLDHAYTKKLKVTFDPKEEVANDIEISSCRQEITNLLKKTERTVRQIATVELDQNVSHQEATVRANSIRSLSSELMQITETLRRTQKDYLLRVQNQDQTKLYFIDEREEEESIRSTEQTQIQNQNLEREREIVRISENINELSMMFKHLDNLILEQGTILDRIDANLEKVNVFVDSGKNEVVKADKISKNSCMFKILIILILVVVLLIVIFSIKMSS